jgi:deoxyribose-phosphate aldolase
MASEPDLSAETRRAHSGREHEPAATVRPDLARIIDHTLLRPDATREELRRLCAEAVTHGFFAVCVNGASVAPAREQLRGTTVVVCTVVGFPLGAGTARAKASEAADAVANGADEIDMVINLGALRDREYTCVFNEVAQVVGAVEGRAVKVILETGALGREDKIAACALAKAAGAHFVKTSTGFGPGGASCDDVALLRAIVGPGFGVKASGGIRTAQDADALVAAGATRLGTSASVAIVTEGANGAGGGP